MTGHDFVAYELMENGQYKSILVMLQRRELQDDGLPELLAAMRAEAADLWDDFDAMTEAAGFREAMQCIQVVSEIIGIIEERIKTYG